MVELYLYLLYSKYCDISIFNNQYVWCCICLVSDSKETAFSTANKQALESVLCFINALIAAPSTPSAMCADASHICRMMSADTCSLEEVDHSVQLLERLQKPTGQLLGLSQ